MRYLLFVSHGGLAAGMAEALGMLVGQRDDVLHTSFKDGVALPDFREEVRQVTAPITREDEVIVMADLVSGSPLTTTMSLLAETLDLNRVRAVGGMSLPMAVTAVEGEDDPLDETFQSMLACAADEIKPFRLDVGGDDEI